MKFVLFGMVGIVAASLWIWIIYLRHYKGWAKWLHWLPLILLVLCVSLGGSRMLGWYLMTALITAFFIPQGVFAVFSFIGRMGSLFWKPFSKCGLISGIAVSSVVVCMALYGLVFGWRHVIVNEIEVPFADLPSSFDGYRIAQISDLHIGTFEFSPETVSAIVEKVNASSPDVILFTGDMVNLSPDELEPFVNVLSRLNAPDGVFSIMGNHDYLGYVHYDSPGEQEVQQRRLIGMERSAGMDLLLNENRIIRHGCDSIALIGVENDGRPPFPERGDLTKSQAGLPSGIFKVLMSHDPTHWRRKVLPDTDIDLTLSGHTHAMQFRIGNFSPSMFLYHEWGGLYSEGERRLFVSTGTGGNIAYRWGAWPEIDVLVLRRK